MIDTTYEKPSSAELRKRLSALDYEVTQHGATEPPFRNRLWDNHEAGLYVDIVSGEPLFSSRDKFDSGTGWPSFTGPVEPERVVEDRDVSHGMTRVEVRSRSGDSHLGHVFPDGPGPTRLRYCINSASLRFVPVAEMEREGYGAYVPAVTGEARLTPEEAERAKANACALPKPGEAVSCQATIEEAVLAGGCFWGMEDILRKVPGVLDTEVGYAGGTTARPRYTDVKTGRTGHTEAIRVHFDPAKLSYAELLEKWFYRMHDPTTKDRQGNDRGSQYRSAIFVTSPEQRRVAEEVTRRVDASGRWKGPIVTEIVDAGPFTSAEDFHQDYLEKNPGGYSCHFVRS